jgi:hypothetical protein
MLAYARDFADSTYARKFPCKFPVVYRGAPICSSIGCTCKRTRHVPQLVAFNAATDRAVPRRLLAARVSSVAQPFSANEANFRKRSQRQNHSKKQCLNMNNTTLGQTNPARARTEREQAELARALPSPAIVGVLRAPAAQALLDHLDHGRHRQRQRREHHHAGKDDIDVVAARRAHHHHP